MKQEGGMDAGGACSALDDANTTVGYPVVLRAAGCRKFPSNTMTGIHNIYPQATTQ